jgi:hypothetical protein
VIRNSELLIFFLQKAQGGLDGRCEEPGDYVALLAKAHELSSKNVASIISSLRVDLTNRTLEWVKQFGSTGLKTLLNVLSHCHLKIG